MTIKDLTRNRKTGNAKSTGTALSGLLRLVKESGSRASASYLKLVVAFPIRPIRSDSELDEAIRVLDGLLSRKKPLDVEEKGYFDSLTNEIWRYEEENIPMPTVTGSEMLRYLIEARDATLSEVAAGTGIVVSTISSVLTGKRQLNRGHIEKLARYFKVSPAAFLE